MRSIVDLAHNLGMRTVAEGVEDAATAEALHDLGCDLAQGWLWASARPIDELIEWLAEARSGRAPHTHPPTGHGPGRPPAVLVGRNGAPPA